jgi:hypothetical protein
MRSSRNNRRTIEICIFEKLCLKVFVRTVGDLFRKHESRRIEKVKKKLFSESYARMMMMMMMMFTFLMMGCDL